MEITVSVDNVVDLYFGQRQGENHVWNYDMIIVNNKKIYIYTLYYIMLLFKYCCLEIDLQFLKEAQRITSGLIVGKIKSLVSGNIPLM